MVGTPVRWVSCGWHWDKAIVQRIQDPELQARIKALRLVPIKEDFWGLWEALFTSHGHLDEMKKFERDYGKTGRISPIHQWARCYNPNFSPHNIFPER